jgi:signal transduction histidine kinase
MGHELNNSLAPIKSLSVSLEEMTGRDPLTEDWREDLHRGLRVIGSRADSLNRFMGAYSALARLPQPAPGPLDLAGLVLRVAEMETRLKPDIDGSPPITISADRDQLEQLLINLVRNATDASLETGGKVRISWAVNGGHLELAVLDEGPGLPDSANLFVPFFTTKPGGSGVGLFLCRQIAEAHGGSLQLADRTDGPGCKALLRLPL